MKLQLFTLSGIIEIDTSNINEASLNKLGLTSADLPGLIPRNLPEELDALKARVATLEK